MIHANSNDDDQHPEVSDLIAEVRARQRHAVQLAAHPHPADPDYPGVWGEDEGEAS